LAEDTGLVVPLGLEVLRQACREVVALRQLPGLEALTVHVNISGVELREPSCARAVAAVLADTGCPAEALTLEVTETSALVEGAAALATMAALQAQGVRLVLDDFGGARRRCRGSRWTGAACSGCWTTGATGRS
jgi:EAL domain-containing protein (putative c-di-GMP-specific phosphodiesterase class I)